MATYPNDASWSAENVFSALNSVEFTNTGATTDFNLGVYVNTVGEVFAIVDSIVQETTTYTLSNSGGTVNFLTAPDASNLTLRSLSIPSEYKKIQSVDQFYTVNYSNTSTTVVDSNTYIINGVDTAFAVPVDVIPSAKEQIFVIVDGTVQPNDSYTWPSATLGTVGIDISPALDTPSSLEIRVISGTSRYTSRKDSMADRKPDIGYSEGRSFDSVSFESQAGYESYRLRSRRPKRTYELTYTNITGIEKQALQSFYDARSGNFEKFTFDLDHINGIGNVTVRFEGENLDVQHKGTRSSNLIDNYYDVTIRLKESFI